MSAQNRAALLGKIHKVLKKHYKVTAPPTDRTVLEHLLYACCLENARPEDADEAYARLQQSFFDWNEVRVTTIAELSEHMANLPSPTAAASSIKRALQAVFEAHFAFDLEFLKKQNLGKSEKDLERYTSANPFLISYVVQHSLGGHAIPCCQGVLDALVVVGAATASEAEKRHVPGMERAIAKNKGHEFASLLHQLGADVVIAPTSSRVKSILLEIAPDAKDRLPKKRKEDEPLSASTGKEAAPSAKSSAGVAKSAAPASESIKPVADSRKKGTPPREAAKPHEGGKGHEGGKSHESKAHDGKSHEASEASGKAGRSEHPSKSESASKSEHSSKSGSKGDSKSESKSDSKSDAARKHAAKAEHSRADDKKSVKKLAKKKPR